MHFRSSTSIPHSFCFALFVLCVGSLFTTVDAGEVPTKIGGEFQIDSGPQDLYHDVPKVAVGQDGSFAVVWQSQTSTGTDSSSHSIQWRRFGADSAPASDVAQVNTYTSSFQLQPGIAVQDNGEFFVVWQSLGSSGSDNSESSIQAQRFDASGQAQGGEFQVNEVTAGNQTMPSVVELSNGDLLAVWTSTTSAGADTSGTSIQAQRLGPLGGHLGSQFEVNTYTPGSQDAPVVAAMPDGGFVLAWASEGSAGSDGQASSVQGQRFDSAGQPISGQFQVNTYTTGEQREPDISIAQDGSFLVVWEGVGPTTGGFPGIHGRLYDSVGQPQGEQIEIDSAANFLNDPAAAVGPGGQHLVVWSGPIPAVSGGAVLGQVVAPDGGLLDDSFQVDTMATYAYRPTVASNDAGEFVVAWHDLIYPQSGGSYLLINRIEAQRLRLSLFSDGFESGDTTTWSETVD